MGFRKRGFSAVMDSGGLKHMNRQTDRLLALILLLSAWQFVLHAGHAWKSSDPMMWVVHLVTWVHDILILAIILAAGGALIRLAPNPLRPAVKALSYTVTICCGVLLSTCPQLLREYVALPVNIFSTDSATAWTTISSYVGIGNLWPVGITILTGSAVLITPNRPWLNFRWKSLSAGIAFILLVAAFLTLPRSPHPLINSINLQFRELTSAKQRVVPSLFLAASRKAIGTPAKSQTPVIHAESSVDHLFLIVLEGVASQDFEKEFMVRRGGFYQRVKNKASWFSNYHTTNLDSYTSLIAMLTGELVPYRSYTDVSLYERVNETDNLTRSLVSQRYFSLFLSTYAEQPFVPTRGDWRRIMDRDDLPSLDGWLSLGSNRMEQATEDRAALNTIVQTAEVNNRTFILHELVYGHSTQWQARTGKSPLLYYDGYLNELLDRLEVKGLDSRSLLVIVSDHGNRAKAADAENYRVPLLVVGKNVPSRTEEGFRSHLDLPAIVAGFMNGTGLPPSRKEIYVVGSTARWIYGKITADSRSLFVEDISGTVLSTRGGLSETGVNREFQALLDSFSRRFGRSHH